MRNITENECKYSDETGAGYRVFSFITFSVSILLCSLALYYSNMVPIFVGSGGALLLSAFSVVNANKHAKIVKSYFEQEGKKLDK